MEDSDNEFKITKMSSKIQKNLTFHLFKSQYLMRSKQIKGIVGSYCYVHLRRLKKNEIYGIINKSANRAADYA